MFTLCLVSRHYRPTLRVSRAWSSPCAVIFVSHLLMRCGATAAGSSTIQCSPKLPGLSLMAYPQEWTRHQSVHLVNTLRLSYTLRLRKTDCMINQAGVTSVMSQNC